MKVIFFSDVHLHPWTYGASTDEYGMNTRLAAQHNALMEMVEYALQHGIEYLYFCGDLFHTHSTVHAQALYVASNFYKTIEETGLKLRVIPGNHDYANRSGMINTLSWLPMEVQRGTWHDNDMFVTSLPYTDNEDYIKEFMENAATLPKGSIIMLHQGVAGVPLSSGYVMDERLTPAMIPSNVTAFTGHYHFHRRVSDNLTVVGNLTPLNWNDLGQEKGWVVFDTETRAIKQVVQTRAPEFRLVGRDNRECRNAFVRYSEPTSREEQNEIRAALINEGALTVEFPLTEGEGKTNATSPKSEEVTLTQLVNLYVSLQTDPRRKLVGELVREGKYEY
jgi:DNA repair exonuclease SbcCD nuclease subunit